MKSFVYRFLEELSETINTLNHESNSNLFNSSIAMFSALILTGLASFTFKPKLQLLILALSFILMLSARSRIYSWLKIILITTLWATTVSTPLIFTTPGGLVNMSLGLLELRISLEGVYLMTTFIIRVVAAGAIFTAFIFILGWRRTVEGLKGLKIPNGIVSLLSISIIYIPFLTREMVKMLSAREARILRRAKLREVWHVLASIIGDLILRSFERAWRLEKAIKARCFILNSPRVGESKMKIWINDLTLLTLTFFVLLLGFLAW